MTIQQRTSQVLARPQPVGSSRPMPEVAGVAHRYINTGRLNVHVAEAGSGPPVLLLHGWPQHWYAWRELIPLLAGLIGLFNSFRMMRLPDPEPSEAAEAMALG